MTAAAIAGFAGIIIIAGLMVRAVITLVREICVNKTWICDIDGTVAIMGDRSPFNWEEVDKDLPNDTVIRVVEALMYNGDDVVFLSGRMEQAREKTARWLTRHIDSVAIHSVDCCQQLFMRRDGDFRPDTEVKKELYENHIRGNYDVIGVIDDRNSVVRMWREELGLTVLHVADHDF